MIEGEAPTAQDFVAALKAGDRVKVRSIVRSLLEHEVSLGLQWKAVAQVMLNDGEVALARQAADALAADGRDPLARYEKAAIYARSGRPQIAAEILESVPDNVPDRASHYYTKGTLATNLGKMEEARKFLRKAVEFAPQSGEAWLALAMAGGLNEDLSQALDNAQPRALAASGAAAAAYLAARGRQHERAGEHGLAFAAYRESGVRLGGLGSYDGAADEAEARRLLATTLEVSQSSKPETQSPIFVTGLPRSGTTLVEQILASSEEIGGAAELELLPQVARLVGSGAAEAIADYQGEEDPAQFYLRLAEERLAPGRIVDKSLSTSRHMPLAAALFPGARVVWMRRDAMDCAWSAFRTYFISGVTWSRSLEGIGKHFALEDALFEHWRKELRERVLVVDYAELIEDSEGVINAIAEHCGLPVTPAMLNPHESERAVITNSAAQVREPINRKGIGSSAPYAEMLDPFREAYEATAAKLA